MNFLQANRIAPDGTPRFAASHLGLLCLPMSHKKDSRLIWVNFCEFFRNVGFVCFDALPPTKQLWSCWDVTSNFAGLLPDIETK